MVTKQEWFNNGYHLQKHVRDYSKIGYGCGWPLCAYYDDRAEPMNCARGSYPNNYSPLLCSYEQQKDTR